MIKALQYLFDFFSFVIQLIKSIGNLLVSLVTVLGKCVAFLYDVVDPLPGIIKASVLALIIVCVLYKILGRENQS